MGWINNFFCLFFNVCIFNFFFLFMNLSFVYIIYFGFMFRLFLFIVMLLLFLFMFLFLYLNLFFRLFLFWLWLRILIFNFDQANDYIIDILNLLNFWRTKSFEICYFKNVLFFKTQNFHILLIHQFCNLLLLNIMFFPQVWQIQMNRYSHSWSKFLYFCCAVTVFIIFFKFDSIFLKCLKMCLNLVIVLFEI